MVIKPSGVPYAQLTPAMMVVIDLKTGIPIGDNKFRPSSDANTHLALYRAFDAIGSIVHTHAP
jgi:L-ribulose-5-phosphate 4-epimerase